jgi:acyl-CoA thioesterase
MNGSGTPTELARAAAQAMWANDRASPGLGMSIDDVSPGACTISMTVRNDMVNGHDLCHGGLIFTLADSAMAFASNSHNRNSVAQHASINFIRPGKLGDRLTARAVERSRTGRSGLYDVTVTSQTGDVIAEFRGMTRTIDGTLVPEPPKS